MADNQSYNVDTNGQTVTWGTALTSSGGSLTCFPQPPAAC